MVLPSSSSDQPLGHTAGSPAPSPLRLVPFFLSREDFPISSHANSRRPYRFGNAILVRGEMALTLPSIHINGTPLQRLSHPNSKQFLCVGTTVFQEQPQHDTTRYAIYTFRNAVCRRTRACTYLRICSVLFFSLPFCRLSSKKCMRSFFLSSKFHEQHPYHTSHFGLSYRMKYDARLGSYII